MGVKQVLMERSGEKCELCGATDDLCVTGVDPSDESAEQSILLCGTCASLIENPSQNINHWHCLNETMWSQEPAVQVMVYRILKSIASEGWPQDMLDMLYLEPEVEAWAQTGMEEETREPTRDSNGTILEEGDSVSIIKDLVVKGAGFTAKQGTTVKNIHLVPDNHEQIEGKVNGSRIVLLSKFLKKL